MMSGRAHVTRCQPSRTFNPTYHFMSVISLQSIAGATVYCESVGNAYGCASANASSTEWATAYAGGLAEAWASAWAGNGCCQNTAVVSAEGLAKLQIELLAHASANAGATTCVSGAPI
jgi:hypothetical protein